jgi:hypothetical protein
MASKIEKTVRGNVAHEITFGGAQVVDDVVLVGVMPVYTLEATDTGLKASVQILGCSLTANLSVKGADGVGNSAVAVGDALYKDGTEINKDVTNGKKIGYALGTVTSGATATIEVALTGS